MRRCVLFGVFCTVVTMLADLAQAGPLVSAYEKAQKIDPLFLAAIAEREANLIQAQIAGTAYYPKLNIGTAQLENEGGGQRRTISVQQPVISIDRYATMREEGPRVLIANASIRLKEKDLASRLYQAFASVVQAREGLRQNKAKLDAIEQQLNAARRSFALGQGTITDVRDTEVRLLQAKAESMKMRAQELASSKEYESIVGEPLADVPLARHWTAERIKLAADADREANPELIIARQQARLGELGVTKAKSAWIPNLNFSYTMTDLDGDKNSFSGLSMSLPVDAGGIYGVRTADINLVKLREELRDKERGVTLEIDRLHSLLETAAQEIETRLAAIEAAKVSVEANEKSFKGGVRSMLDVLTSIETQFAVHMEYVGTLLELGTNLMSYKLQLGNGTVDGFREVEQAILE